MDRKEQLEMGIEHLLVLIEGKMNRTAYYINSTMKWKKLPIRIMKKYAKKQVYWHWVEQTAPAILEWPRGGKLSVVARAQYKYLSSSFGWKEVKKWNMRYGQIKESNSSPDGKKKHVSFVALPGQNSKLIFTNTAKKITRWDKQIKKLYEVRKEVKKLRKKLQKGIRVYDAARTYKKLFEQADEIDKEIERINSSWGGHITMGKKKEQGNFKKLLTKFFNSGNL